MIEGYRVRWQIRGTNRGGHGEPLHSLDTAIAWAAAMNTEYPDIHHWVETVIAPPSPVTPAED